MHLSPATSRIFLPLSPAQRASATELYFDYLCAREGRLDLGTRTLARREPFFGELESNPVRARDPVDAEVFHRNHNRRSPEPGLSPELLWLLAIAKANRTEYFGMEQHIAVNGILDGDAATTQSYVDMQEVYHTRILLDVLRCFELEIEVQPPSLASRLAVHAMVRLPQRAAMPLILCAELLASLMFRLMLDKGRELFGHDEALWARVSQLLQQIMVDEVGHVSYCRARLGRAGLAAARALLPSVTRSLLSDQPEVEELLGREAFVAAVSAMDVSKLAADCGDQPFWLEPELS